ncbi:MAG: hypothetical protein ACTSQ8_27140 [Candidatus Helarchaeota archaeon]
MKDKSKIMNRILLLIILCLILVACSPSAEEIAIATWRAERAMYTDTPIVIATIESTITLQPTDTVEPTVTVEPTPTMIPTSVMTTVIFEGKNYQRGQGVVSFRFDDGDISDYEYVFPELEKRGLVGGFAVVRSLIGGCNRTTLEDNLIMQSAGNEIMCHSYTHGDDPPDFDEFYFQTVTAAQEMRMMGLNVVAFVPPGNWNDPYPSGYRINSEDFFSSDEDLLLRNNFKLYDGYIDDFDGKYYYTLPTSQWGKSHKTGDKLSLSSLQRIIDRIATYGEALELCFHPNSFGRSDEYITKADFESFLDYVADKVASGEIVQMTPTEMTFATEAGE